MSGLLGKLANLIIGDDGNSAGVQETTNLLRSKITERDLLREESKIGSTLFGQVPNGRSREFFCLDESTWIWHEEWRDEKGVDRQSTVRYEIHPNGILKVTDGPRYSFIEGAELENFAKATRMYYEETARKVYNRDPKTGVRFA